MLVTEVRKYPLLKMVTCSRCDIVFENTEKAKNYTYCPGCGRVKDTRDRSAANQERANLRKSQGLCVYCGKEHSEKTRTRCRGCINKSTTRKRISRRRKLDTGLCSRCGKESLTTDEAGLQLTIGRNCQQMLNKSRAKSYHRLKQNGKCVFCYVADAIKGMTNCERCRDEKNYASSIRHWKWRFTTLMGMGGKCISCGNTELDILHIHHKELYRHGHNTDQHRLSWMKITEQLRKNIIVQEKFWKDVREGNLFLLCPNCNWRDALDQMGNNKAREEALRIVLKTSIEQSKDLRCS
jgi:hypothetical protein